VAVSAGSIDVVKFLADFGNTRATPESFLKALANGSAELIHLFWDAWPEERRVVRPQFLEVAGDYHRVDVVLWLFEQAAPRVRESFFIFALRRRMADSLVAVFDGGYRPWSRAAREVAAGWPAARDLEFATTPAYAQEPPNCLLRRFATELGALGLDLSGAELMIAHDAGPWDFAGEYWVSARGVIPALLLVAAPDSTVYGAFEPPLADEDEDPLAFVRRRGRSIGDVRFVFRLVPALERFGARDDYGAFAKLLTPEMTRTRYFECGGGLFVCETGEFAALSCGADRLLPFERFELWRIWAATRPGPARANSLAASGL
jgi:hypothetical protein